MCMCGKAAEWGFTRDEMATFAKVRIKVYKL